ncbi:biotin/lipoyl-containing protein, partial [Stella sp.]|uniref:biotin/lipoyl-containing protein n=1 Tax=Stella sp. TaxID=2912054 RepID=UPI0035B21759
MGTWTVKLPDVGEGVAEAELVEWNVAVGTRVAEDQVLASVMTDKAAVEIPSPVAGTVAWLAGEVGDRIAVGAPLVRIEVAGDGNAAGEPVPPPAPAGPEPGPGPEPPPEPVPAARPAPPGPGPAAPRRAGQKPL